VFLIGQGANAQLTYSEGMSDVLIAEKANRADIAAAIREHQGKAR
jgi:hypothetical protein